MVSNSENTALRPANGEKIKKGFRRGIEGPRCPDDPARHHSHHIAFDAFARADHDGHVRKEFAGYHGVSDLDASADGLVFLQLQRGVFSTFLSYAQYDFDRSDLHFRHAAIELLYRFSV